LFVVKKIKNEATVVASSRSSSRVEKNNNIKTGAQRQQEFQQMFEQLGKKAGLKIWSEPDANTLNNILNKKDKKKLN